MMCSANTEYHLVDALCGISYHLPECELLVKNKLQNLHFDCIHAEIYFNNDCPGIILIMIML